MNSPHALDVAPPPRPRRCFWAACAALLLAGCADASDPAPPRSTVRGGPAPTVPVEVRPGASLDRILAATDGVSLRPPRSVRTEPVVNEYVAGQTDTVRTRVYDGIEVETYEVAGGRTFVQRVTVSEGGYGTSSGVAVGETREALDAVLGLPLAERGDVAVYETGGEAPTTVEVRYEPDGDGVLRASEITWRPYLD